MRGISRSTLGCNVRWEVRVVHPLRGLRREVQHVHLLRGLRREFLVASHWVVSVRCQSVQVVSASVSQDRRGRFDPFGFLLFITRTLAGCNTVSQVGLSPGPWDVLHAIFHLSTSYGVSLLRYSAVMSVALVHVGAINNVFILNIN